MEQPDPQKYILPGIARKYLTLYHKFAFKSTDVVVMGFPRSGATVTQEMVWMICNNADVRRAKARPLIERSPSLEHLNIFENDISIKTKENATYILEVWHRFITDIKIRFMKVHVPFSLLAPDFLSTGCQAIYVIRDPREIVVSNYKLVKKTAPKSFSMPFVQFWNSFKSSKFIWTPFFEALNEAWEKKDLNNLLLVSYKGIVKDRRQTIDLVAKFLGKNLTEDEMDTIEEYLDTKFVQIKNLIAARQRKRFNESEEPFVRDDEEWKKYFVGPLENEVNVWVEESLRNYHMPADLFDVLRF